MRAVRSWFVAIATVILLTLLISPSPAAAQRARWEIVPGVFLTYNPRMWQLNTAMNQLENIAAPGCALSQNAGRGIPDDWKVRETRIRRGTHSLIRKTYYDARWQVQFAVYRYTRPTNLGYLNSEGVLLTPPNALRLWSMCRSAAEFVLATAKREGG